MHFENVQYVAMWYISNGIIFFKSVFFNTFFSIDKMNKYSCLLFNYILEKIILVIEILIFISIRVFLQVIDVVLIPDFFVLLSKENFTKHKIYA